MKNPVVWFEIYVDDMVRATKFYETVFATKLENMSDPSDQNLQMMGFAMGNDKSYGTSGALVKMNGKEAGGNSTLVYFGTNDCVTEESRVTEAGGQVIKPKMNIGKYGFISICVDTEGNYFGLHSMN